LGVLDVDGKPNVGGFMICDCVGVQGWVGGGASRVEQEGFGQHGGLEWDCLFVEIFFSRN
jgi:hypothetical protein